MPGTKKAAIRISLTEKDGEIKGQICLPADGTFTLEALKMITEYMAKATDQPVSKVAANIYQYTMGLVK